MVISSVQLRYDFYYLAVILLNLLPVRLLGFCAFKCISNGEMYVNLE